MIVFAKRSVSPRSYISGKTMTATISTRALRYATLAMTLGLAACTENASPDPTGDEEQERLRASMDLGTPPLPEDMPLSVDGMTFEADLDAAPSPLDMPSDMSDEDFGLSEACEYTVANVYWMIDHIQAVDSNDMDLRDTPIGPIIGEGTAHFVGVVRERHEAQNTNRSSRWFYLDASDPSTYTPHVRLLFREWPGHPLPDFQVGDELSIERHTSVGGCALAAASGGVTTFFFTTIREANTDALLYVEGDAMLMHGGEIVLPTGAPFQSWRWRYATGCDSDPRSPHVLIETEDDQAITAGKATVTVEGQDLDVFTFQLMGSPEASTATCGLWKFYATPRDP